ncbi:hypothetical protein LguiB_003197 [Lonicera macranthoides]
MEDLFTSLYYYCSNKKKKILKSNTSRLSSNKWDSSQWTIIPSPTVTCLN